LWSAYEETSPHNLTIIAGGELIYPWLESCAEKAGLSLICRPGHGSLG
jgi:hypothetical protein